MRSQTPRSLTTRVGTTPPDPEVRRGDSEEGPADGEVTQGGDGEEVVQSRRGQTRTVIGSVSRSVFVHDRVSVS